MVPVLLGPESSAKWTALLVTAVEFVLSLGLWWALDPSRGTLQLVSNTPWIPHWGIAYRVGIDGISLVMVLLTTLLMPHQRAGELPTTSPSRSAASTR